MSAFHGKADMQQSGLGFGLATVSLCLTTDMILTVLDSLHGLDIDGPVKRTQLIRDEGGVSVLACTVSLIIVARGEANDGDGTPLSIDHLGQPLPYWLGDG
jgi:hypothetical protein